MNKLADVDIDTEKNITIATSNDLIIGAQWPKLERYEQRIVIHMMSLIRKEDEDFQDYRISIKELKEVFDLKSEGGAIYKMFDKAVKGLMSKTIRFIDPSYKKSIKEVEVAWCSYAARVKGEGFVELRFDPALKPFFIALKGNFTIWGDRRSLLALNSHYSLRIYQFIKYSQGMANVTKNENSTIVTLEWFREFLAIGPNKHKVFGNLRSRVLDPAKKEINTKTDVKIKWQPIRKGRKIVSLKFSWCDNPRNKQLTLPGHNPEGNSIVDILTIEFGISEKFAERISQKYPIKKIKEALQGAREYIEALRNTGQKIKSPAGVAIRAIEEEWKSKTLIEMEYEKEKKKKEEEKRREKEKKKSKEEQERERALLRFNKMEEKEQQEILEKFRGYLLSTGNLAVVTKFDEKGIVPGAIEAMFDLFIVEMFQ